jgi:hypothetical protein
MFIDSIIEKINLNFNQFKNLILKLEEPKLLNEMQSNYLLTGNNSCNNHCRQTYRSDLCCTGLESFIQPTD